MVAKVFWGITEHEVRDHFYNCHAGVNVASVLADATISACPSIRANFNQGNIYTDNFMEVWNNRFQPFATARGAPGPMCRLLPLALFAKATAWHLHDDQGRLLVCHYDRIC
jgi:hypothetical protein